MPLPWFHVESIPDPGHAIELDDAEARHATGSRRLTSEDRVALFDGQGAVAEASLAASIAGRRRVAAALVLARSIVPRLQPIVHLAAALPRGERQAVMLGMATQLGIASFTPLECTYSVAEPGPSFADRARRICLESCKQCRCAYLPAIADSCSPREAAERARARGEMIWLAHPGGPSVRDLTDAHVRAADHQRGHVVLIGPEGGFRDEEVAAMSACGARVCDLGPTLLRTETAAVALVAWLRLALA